MTKIKKCELCNKALDKLDNDCFGTNLCPKCLIEEDEHHQRSKKDLAQKGKIYNKFKKN